MEQLLLQVVGHPYESIAVLLSLCAGAALFIFMAGFFSGFRQFTRIDLGEDHVQHARTRAVWGVILLIFLFLVWETVRVIAGFLNGTANTGLAYFLGAFWIVYILLLFVPFKKPWKAKH